MEAKTYTYEEALKIVIKNGNLFENGYQTEISDYEFDGLVKLIKEVDPTFDYRDHVSYEADGKEAKHQITFRDFEKNYDIGNYVTEEMFNELKSNYVILPKFDGSSIVGYLEDGNIKNVLSKSDKNFGFVNTKKLSEKMKKAIESTGILPTEIKAICCEAVCNKDNGARSRANGLINSKYLQDDVDKYLELLPWDIVYTDGHRYPNTKFEVTNYDEFVLLRDKGEYATEYGVIPCDGVVCYPRNGNENLLIIKIYSLEEKESTVTSVTWDPSDYGLFHPVAEFDTVIFESDGRSVSRVNMSNIDLLKSRKIVPGSKLKVALAGSAIPSYIDTTYAPYNWGKYFDEDEAGRYDIHCPDCKSKLIRCGDSSDLICSSANCSWWYKIFKYRLLELVLGSELTEDIVSTIMMEDANDTKTLDVVKQEKGINSWREYIYESVEHLFGMIQIQRVSDAKYENMIHMCKGGSSAKESIVTFTSDKQFDYFNAVETKLNSFIEHID